MQTGWFGDSGKGSHILFITVLSLGWKHHCWILMTFLKGLRRHALTQDQLSRGQLWLWKPFGSNLRNAIYFIAEEDTLLWFIQFVSFVNRWTLAIKIKPVVTSKWLSGGVTSDSLHVETICRIHCKQKSNLWKIQSFFLHN